MCTQGLQITEGGNSTRTSGQTAPSFIAIGLSAVVVLGAVAAGLVQIIRRRRRQPRNISAALFESLEDELRTISGLANLPAGAFCSDVPVEDLNMASGAIRLSVRHGAVLSVPKPLMTTMPDGRTAPAADPPRSVMVLCAVVDGHQPFVGDFTHGGSDYQLVAVSCTTAAPVMQIAVVGEDGTPWLLPAASSELSAAPAASVVAKGRGFRLVVWRRVP